MSMSLFVVLALSVEPSTKELNEYSKEHGYNIEYTHEANLAEMSGFLPAKLNSKDAGVEVYSFPASELPTPFKSIIPEIYNDGIVFQFRFGGKSVEAQTAFTTAIILNTKYGGVSLDGQSGHLMSVEHLEQLNSYFGGM
ncbi:MAG: hypothetical protein MI864_02695 [Pseudomonadales bacterium]|nr:hypothetical protein [Pseudomonadales bacterium]